MRGRITPIGDAKAPNKRSRKKSRDAPDDRSLTPLNESNAFSQ